MPRKTLKKIQHSESASNDQAVIYFRVSSKPQDGDGFSLPAQRKLLLEYGHSIAPRIVEEFVDIETAKTSGRSAFGQMVKFLQKNPSVTHILVEKTDRLYRNFKDYVLIDELMHPTPRKRWPGSFSRLQVFRKVPSWHQGSHGEELYR
jgi:predicted site-specific integrase-resolvase